MRLLCVQAMYLCPDKKNTLTTSKLFSYNNKQYLFLHSLLLDYSLLLALVRRFIHHKWLKLAAPGWLLAADTAWHRCEASHNIDARKERIHKASIHNAPNCLPACLPAS